MTAPIALILAGIVYVAILAAGSLLSQPVRLRLVSVADSMLVEPQWNKRERASIEWLVLSCTSTAVGVFLPVASAYIMIRSALGAAPKADPEMKRLQSDPRADRLLACYMLSIMMCSPFAALLSLPFILGTVGARALWGDRQLKQAAEAPILNASSAFQPC